ncbi:hypothetical protein NQ314_018960 [Rhamnusium bicolor]|uniref:Uncharacterized protein n=1 Tax=Rhamnusium bicolor TaxID=1586634 RepID=A0AAV8WP19_9CUCU|nr:hypothetical protein NQ314_018960 [Rhamnusium bicolor]
MHANNVMDRFVIRTPAATATHEVIQPSSSVPLEYNENTTRCPKRAIENILVTSSSSDSESNESENAANESEIENEEPLKKKILPAKI